MKLFAIGWTAWRSESGQTHIINGAAAMRRVDVDHAEGATLRALRDKFPPERGWSLAAKAIEVPAALLSEEPAP